MTSGLRLVVFDWDGTIVDSAGAIIAAMGEAFAAHGFAEPIASDVRQVVGLSLEEAIGRLLPRAADVVPAVVADSYRAAYAAHRTRPNDVESVLFEGAAQALSTLDDAGILCAIATGKSRRGIERALERTGLARYFIARATADDAPGKPDPAMLIQVMTAAGVDPSVTVMVGDTVYDVGMARNAGTGALGVAWGYHAAHDLRAAGATAIVERFSALPELVEAVLAAR